MNIVFVGNFHVDYSSETHHVKSLEYLGHNVLKLQEGVATGDEILEKSIESDLLVFVHTHGWITPGLSMDIVFKALKRARVKTMTYHLDLWLGLEREKDLHDDPFYKTIGHFFATDKLMADWFNDNTEVKGHFIPAGVFHEEVELLKKPEVQTEYEIIFVGSKGYHPEYPYRPQLINWLRETYGKKFLHIGGDGDTGTIRGLKLNEYYRNAKVAIGDSLNINFSYPWYTSDRLFESTGRGGFTIYPDIEGLDTLFERDKEVVFYKHGDLADLKSKIDYYLEHDEERESVRLAGFMRTAKDHTYASRWKEILETLYGTDNLLG